MEEDYDRESVGEYVDSDGPELEPGMKSGITSIINNVQIGGVDIRKKELQKKTDEYLAREGINETNDGDEIKPLYRILKEVDTGVSDGQVMGTGHTYEYSDQKKPENGEPQAEKPDEAEIKKPKKEKKEKIKYKF